MPGSQPTVEIAVLDQGMPTSGSRSQAASTESRFMSGSPMPMNTAFVTALRAAEVERLVEDLGGGEVAAEAHPAGRAEGAGERAARLARQAERAAPVAVAHQHRLERARVVRAEQRLARAVRGHRLALELERGQRHLVRQPPAQLERQVRHVLVRLRAAGGPLPHLLCAEAGLAARAQALVEQLQVHASRVWQPWGHATGQVHRSRGRGLATRRRAAGGRAPRASQRRGGHGSRPRRGRAERRDGGRPRGHGGAARGARAQQAGRRGVHRPRHPRAPDGRGARALAPAPLSGGAARRRLHRADPADQRRAARRAAHAPALRHREGLPRPCGARSAEPARPSGAARRRAAGRREDRAGARAPGGARHAGDRAARGPQAPGAAHVRGRGPPRDGARAGGLRPTRTARDWSAARAASCRVARWSGCAPTTKPAGPRRGGGGVARKGRRARGWKNPAA